MWLIRISSLRISSSCNGIQETTQWQIPIFQCQQMNIFYEYFWFCVQAMSSLILIVNFSCCRSLDRILVAGE